MLQHACCAWRTDRTRCTAIRSANSSCGGSAKRMRPAWATAAISSLLQRRMKKRVAGFSLLSPAEPEAKIMLDQLLQRYADGPVTLSRHADHIVVVTLNRPAARNAVNPEITQRLDDIVHGLEDDNDIWAVLLTGAGGRVFSAGADLKEVAESGFGSLYTERGGFAGFTFAERRKIWIAAIEGFALAGGFELALACDMMVAGESAQFGLPEVGVGL